MSFLFYIFAALALVGGIGVVVNRNPVSSAFAMVVSFLGLAALFIQLDAYLVGILQILVYAGAIMVLFVFIIMLLDVKEEEGKHLKPLSVFGGVVISGMIALLIFKVLCSFPEGQQALTPLADDAVSDVKSIGTLLFNDYFYPVQITGVLLLISTIGVVILSKRELK